MIEAGRVYAKYGGFLLLTLREIVIKGEPGWRCTSLGQTHGGILKYVSKRFLPTNVHASSFLETAPGALPVEMRRGVIVNLFKARGRL